MYVNVTPCFQKKITFHFMKIFSNVNKFPQPETEFKEFDLRLFKPWLKFGWFRLKLYLIFQDLSRRSFETGFWGI